MLCYNNEQLTIRDEIGFSNWSKPPRLKHMDKLNYENEHVQQTIKRFFNTDPFKIYNYIRMFYWSKCNNINEFNEKIKIKLGGIENIEELLDE